MTKKISELIPHPHVNWNELLEVAVPDGGSPTGYITRSINTGQLQSNVNVSIPHRYVIDNSVNVYRYAHYTGEGEINYWCFDLTIPISEIYSEILYLTSGNHDSPLGNNIISAPLHFNFVGAFRGVENSITEIDIPFVCDSDVWFRGGGYMQTSRARASTYGFNSGLTVAGDGQYYTLPQYGMDWDTHNTNNDSVVLPIDTAWDEWSSPHDLKIVFKILPFSGHDSITLTGDSCDIKGYVDFSGITSITSGGE